MNLSPLMSTRLVRHLSVSVAHAILGGIALAVVGSAVPNYFLFISLRFMVNVLFSFSVDH